MYATLPGTRNYWHELSEMSASVAEGIPTFDKRLDTFFDRNAGAIIEEWDLITDEDLVHIQRRLDYLSYEVDRLVITKSSMEKRVQSLKAQIEELEGKQ
jgi:hypothetical protein